MNLAKQLNQTVNELAPALFHNLSDLGKRAYFPKGILAQSQEAKDKARLYNATIGIAVSHKQPMHLSDIRQYLPLIDIQETVTYSPSSGNPKLRQLWSKKILEDTPSLKEGDFSLPVATCGITQAISLAAKMFTNKSDNIVIPAQNWENYELIFNMEREAKIKTYQLFNDEDRFNIEGLHQTLDEVFKSSNKAFLVLNFPNNPTGYSLSGDEQSKIVNLIKKFANLDKFLVVLCDDAYFGLFFDDKIAKQSIFAKLAKLHPNVLALKADGATKEHYVWGFRVGFLSFGYINNNSELYKALLQKVAGLIRADVSNISQPMQAILVKILTSQNYKKDCEKNFSILKKRADEMKKVLMNESFLEYFSHYPFNSGYFMCLKLHKINSEELRKKLLEEYQIGTISFGKRDLRIAFSSVELQDIPDMMQKIFQACKKLA